MRKSGRGRSGRLLVIGEACRQGEVPLRGPSGRRLADLAGISLDEFLSRVEVRNLLPRCPGRKPGSKGCRFPEDLAREGASGLDLRGRRVLLLGQRVARAFGLRGIRPPCQTALGRGEVEAWVIPHPSGIVRWWNHPENRRAAGRTLGGLLGRGVRRGPGTSRGRGGVVKEGAGRGRTT